ncbi:MAG: DUF4845 domain-containing protein [Arenicellales bacterium]|nr:DUF4845 domain-containing protein [Arenicellales bacterium]
MNKQKGWTIWTLLLTLGLIVFFSLLIMKLTPHYLDNRKIQTALDGMTSDTRIASMTRRQIVNELRNGLYIDYGKDIVNLDESLSINKEKGAVNLSVEYEVVVPLAWNISALLDFHNSADVVF